MNEGNPLVEQLRKFGIQKAFNSHNIQPLKNEKQKKLVKQSDLKWFSILCCSTHLRLIHTRKTESDRRQQRLTDANRGFIQPRRSRERTAENETTVHFNREPPPESAQRLHSMTLHFSHLKLKISPFLWNIRIQNHDEATSKCDFVFHFRVILNNPFVSYWPLAFRNQRSHSHNIYYRR